MPKHMPETMSELLEQMAGLLAEVGTSNRNPTVCHSTCQTSWQDQLKAHANWTPQRDPEHFPAFYDG